ncbi:DUF979 domain-containing protein [Lacticaseibacillus absianus]|uniref:DUF979 domain-containing protein n=1 Tax=Lacticaseibacillus absianus TaxID=2729623 RepID=UPI0015CE45B4|nr:DUF979 domain-containing protein [Lacticaseibacillus absianus]
MVDTLLLALYALIGAIMAIAGIESLRDRTNPARYGTGLFWGLLAVIFAFGTLIPYTIVGGMIVLIGLLAAFKQIRLGTLPSLDLKRAAAEAQRIGGWVFAPSIVLAAVSIAIAQFTTLGGQVGIGIGALVSLIMAMILAKAPVSEVYTDTQRMVRSVGAAGILPQLLATLGAVFTAAGVGELTAKLIAGVFPAGNHLLGVALYCIAMALFTAIMGNAFAAFAVITAAVGIPFVVAQGGNPAVVAAIGMTAGYCGTLLTPMAANFNSLPVALQEMEDPMGVIKQQAPVALLMLVVQIGLMYVLAF